LLNDGLVVIKLFNPKAGINGQNFDLKHTKTWHEVFIMKVHYIYIRLIF